MGDNIISNNIMGVGVGVGVGKISLYKGKEVVKKNVPSENAVNELVELIKEHGDWIEKK